MACSAKAFDRPGYRFPASTHPPEAVASSCAAIYFERENAACALTTKVDGTAGIVKNRLHRPHVGCP